MTEHTLNGKTQVRVQLLAPDAVRITHAPKGTAFFPAERAWLNQVLLLQPPLAERDCHLRVSVLAEGVVNVFDDDHHFHLAEANPPHLKVSKTLRTVTPDIPAVTVKTDFARVTNAIELAWTIEAGEGFYGGGEWFNAFRRERGVVNLNTRDAIAMIQNSETYSAIPVFFSSRGYAIWLLNSHASTWTIDPEARTLSVSADGPGADYIVIHGPTFKQIIQTYTQLTGRPPLIPRWAFGLMVTGYPQEQQSVVLERAHEHRQRQVPLDAIILDYHWEERYHNFKWRASVIPDPDGLIAELKALGVRLGLILTPFANSRNRPLQRAFLNRAAGNLPRGEEQADERDLDGFNEGRAQGYFAHEDALWWFGAGGMVDFANPQAEAWWNARMKPLYEQGIAFFKNDDGEYLPLDAKSASGMNGREYHNLYGFFYSRAIYNGMAQLDDRRPFIYARTVWAGSQRFPAMFLGDQKPTFEHILSTQRAGLNLGLLGFAYWTADVFGLDGKTTPETHMRYAQWALLAPVARYFWRPPQTDDTRFPWSHSPQVEDNFRTLTELRYRLLPYFYALAWEAYQTGWPLLRPMVLEYQDDARFMRVSDQMLLGGVLLLAPVTQANATMRTILLPAGMWHDWWSTQTYIGPTTIEYPAPLERLPLLVKGGSIVPLGPVLQHIPDGHQFNALELHLYPPYPAEGVLYEDDGTTRAYQRGAFSVTRFTAEAVDGVLAIRISAAEGVFPAQPPSREFTLVIERTVQPRAVYVNNAVLDAWRYVADEQRLLIPLVARTEVETVVVVG